MSERFNLRKEWLFGGLLLSFCLIYLLWYPATIAIGDESTIAALAYSIEHGSIYLETAGRNWGNNLGNHMVGMQSPFHAALLSPAMAANWHLIFVVSAGFFVAGAFILRAMLRRAGLGSGWTALYFLLAGALYYSQTVVAAVPAAVLCLLGVSLCLRSEPAPFPAGLAFGASVLMHPWMGPIVVVFSAVWTLERRFSGLLELAIGALPSIVLLAGYNFLTTGSPFRNVYTLLGHQYLFQGSHLLGFLAFYLASLAIFPLAGWSVFSRRWSGTYALPATGAVVVAMASMYYYRDGLNLGSATVPAAVALLAGLVPGQRFLLPLSMIACLPAARFLDSRLSTSADSRIAAIKLGALGTLVVGFALLSVFHQEYLHAFAKIQNALHENIPPDAPVAVDWDSDLEKEFAPLSVVYRHLTVIYDNQAPPDEAYVAMLLRPGQPPPHDWIDRRASREIQIRSWIWNRDLLIAQPAGTKG